jgi:hypothetical protein
MWHTFTHNNSRVSAKYAWENQRTRISINSLFPLWCLLRIILFHKQAVNTFHFLEIRYVLTKLQSLWKSNLNLAQHKSWKLSLHLDVFNFTLIYSIKKKWKGGRKYFLFIFHRIFCFSIPQTTLNKASKM